MVNWDFGPRLVARLDMMYVKVWFGSRIKGNVPNEFVVRREEEFHLSWKCAKTKDQLGRIYTRYRVNETRRNVQRGLWTGQYLNNTDF